MSGVASPAQAVQSAALILLLVFGPLSGGATKPWSFSISLWLAVVGAAAMILKRIWLGKSALPRHKYELPMLIFLGLVVISMFTSIHPPSTFWAFLRVVVYLAVFYLALDATASRSTTKHLIAVVIGVGVILCFIGLIKYLGSPLPKFWSYVPKSQAGFFLSTYLNHNHIAGYLAMALALALGMLASNTFYRGLAWLGCVILFLICIVLAMSRGGWIAVGVSLLVMALGMMFKQKAKSLRVIVIGFLLVGVVGLAFLGSSPAVERFKTLEDPADSSRVNRIGIWTASLELIKQKPILGYGLGTFPYVFPSVRPPGVQLRYNEAHSDYIQIVVELGLVVLIPILWGLFLFFKLGLDQIRKSNTSLGTAVSLGAFGGVLAIIVHSVTDFNIQLTANGVLFTLVLGLMVGAYRFRAVVEEPAKKPANQSPAPSSLDFLDAEGNVLDTARSARRSKTSPQPRRRS